MDYTQEIPVHFLLCLIGFLIYNVFLKSPVLFLSYSAFSPCPSPPLPLSLLVPSWSPGTVDRLKGLYPAGSCWSSCYVSCSLLSWVLVPVGLQVCMRTWIVNGKVKSCVSLQGARQCYVFWIQLNQANWHICLIEGYDIRTSKWYGKYYNCQPAWCLIHCVL